MSLHDEEVSKLERELRFFPIEAKNGKRLTAEDIAAFNRDGFLTGLNACSDSEIAEIRAQFDDTLQSFLSGGFSSYAIDRYHDRIAHIYDVAKHPVILDYVEDLLGPDFVCWATHYFCKLPDDRKRVAWHQDCSYWALTPSKTVTVWLAVDDVDAENGAMQVLPGSHLFGHLPWRATEDGEDNVLTQEIDEAERFGKPVDIVLKAGQCSIHSDLLVHGSPANASNRRRCGLTLRYCPVDVRAYWGWNDVSIVCRGNDPSGHWADIPRPKE